VVNDVAGATTAPNDHFGGSGVGVDIRRSGRLEEHMGLATHGLALAFGYIVGRPDGRQHLVELGQQVTELAKKPEVQQLGKRGRDFAGERTQAARSAVSAKLRRDGTGSASASQGPDSDSTGSGGRGVWRRAGRVDAAPAPETSSTPDESAASDPADGATSGFGGTTPVEDTQAVITGIPAPPPAGRTQPPQAE
jgi:hypothetical protein